MEGSDIRRLLAWAATHKTEGFLLAFRRLVTFMFEPLSERQFAVLRLVAAGHRIDRIADTLGVRPETANAHIVKMRKKLGAKTNAEAVAIAKDRGII